MRVDNRRLLALTVVVGLLGVSARAILRVGDDDARYAAVGRGRIEQAIETSGVFQPVESTVVRGTAEGIVETVAVRAGDRVEAGDVVATLDQTAARRQLEAARRTVEEAELAESLARERAADGTDEDVGEALLAAGRAQAARTQLGEAEAALAATLLIAPAPGVVLEVAISAGAPYAAGTPAVVIGGDAFELAASLDQADLPVVAVGSAVRLVPDAVPELELAGTIAEIAPRGEQDGGAVRFAIRVSLAEQPGDAARVRPGMTARVIVPSATVDDALLVPAEAIETVGHRSFVQVRRDGEEQTVEVSLGLRQGGLVQIAAGDLAAGEPVRLGE